MRSRLPAWFASSLAAIAIIDNRKRRKVEPSAVGFFLNLRDGVGRTGEFQDQREQDADNDAGSSQTHPQAASAQQLVGHKQLIQCGTGNGNARNRCDNFQRCQTDSCKNQIGKEDGCISRKRDRNIKFHLLETRSPTSHSCASKYILIISL